MDSVISKIKLILNKCDNPSVCITHNTIIQLFTLKIVSEIQCDLSWHLWWHLWLSSN